MFAIVVVYIIVTTTTTIATTTTTTTTGGGEQGGRNCTRAERIFGGDSYEEITNRRKYSKSLSLSLLTLM